MMKNVKWIVAFLCLASPQAMRAQDSLSVELQADVVSQYIWRGLNLGHISVQPEMALGWKGLRLSAWGNVGLDSKDTREVDLTLSYETGGLSLGVIDYWSDNNDSRYFYYKTPETGHAFEAFVGYDFGCFGVSWQTVFAGNDFSEDDGKRTYSSYLELTAPFTLATCEWEASVGIVPWKAAYYEASGFAVTNISLGVTKDIRITDSFSLPIFGRLIANPSEQQFYFVAGFTLKAF